MWTIGYQFSIRKNWSPRKKTNLQLIYIIQDFWFKYGSISWTAKTFLNRFCAFSAYRVETTLTNYGLEWNFPTHRRTIARRIAFVSKVSGSMLSILELLSRPGIMSLSSLFLSSVTQKYRAPIVNWQTHSMIIWQTIDITKCLSKRKYENSTKKRI